MNALITGGCGFVGSNLAAYLIDQDQANKVTVFDNLSRHGASANLTWLRTLSSAGQNPVEFLQGDICNAVGVEAIVKSLQPDVIFHLAGQVAMTTSIESPRRDFEINVLGSINVLEAVRLYTPKTAIIYASSNKVYGNLGHLDLVETATRYQPRAAQNGVDESVAIEFHTPYGCSKGAADQYMLDYARSFGLNTVVFRHSTIYGGRQFATYDQGWVGWFCRQAIESKADPSRPPFTVSGDGKQVRDLLHISDAVRCYLAAYQNMSAARGQAFNIGGGMQNSMSLIELLRYLEDRLGIKLNYTHLPWRQSDQKFFVADNSKAHTFLAWAPLTSKEDGIESVLNWEKLASTLS
ncbi:MAG: NAD-dependent epimerase/dehydratase family protein [Acidobacteriaceae bacterium]|jgi:CDP-paratose 2-epimerase